MPPTSRHKSSRWRRWLPFRDQRRLRRSDSPPGTNADIAGTKDRIALLWALALGTVTAALLGVVISFMSRR